MAVASKHRLLLIGHDRGQLAALCGALERVGIQTRQTDNAAVASAMAVEFRPTVVVLVTDLVREPAHELLATLGVRPQTAELPLLVLSREAPLAQRISAFTAGVVDIVELPTQLPKFVGRIHDLLGTDPDPLLIRAAKDMRGPALLKRLGNHMRARRESGTLLVVGPPDGGRIDFTDGRVTDARLGPVQGSKAIERLLAVTTAQRWAIRLEGATPPAPPPDEIEAEEETLSISEDISDVVSDIASIDVPVTAANAPSEDLPIEVSDDFEIDETDFAADIETDQVDIFQTSQVTAPPPLEGLEDAPPFPAPLVLVVDDEESLLKMYKNYMVRDGARVETATDGRAGYELALRTRPDAIVSDIMMPDVDGWGFLTMVRQDMRIRDTQFLLLSCHGEYLERLKTLDAGADAYLEKGLRAEEVADEVRSALRSRQRLRARLKPGVSFSGQLSEYGIRPLLRALGEGGMSGVLSMEDRFGQYLVQVELGRLVASSVSVGGTERTGDEAFEVILGLDDASLDFESDVLMLLAETPQDMARVIDEVGGRLNETRRLAEEKMFVSNAPLITDEKLAAFYALVCPESARPIAESLCRGDAPREIMATSDASPLLIESVLRDLLRKGVARFSTS